MPPAPDAREQVKKSAPVKAGRAILLLLAVAAFVAYTGISARRADEEQLAKWTQAQAMPSVAVVTPQRGKEARELVLPGNVDAYYSANIHGQVKGYVQDWREDIGAKVHQGEVLAVVDTPELDQSVAVAQSELAKAKANLALAKVTAARWDSLRASAAVSQQAADEKEADAKARAADVEAAQSNVDRLKAEKGFANIVAPFDGVVTARNVDVGSLVRADGTNAPALFTVADIHQMRIYVAVPEIICRQPQGRHEGDAGIAGISRPHFRRDDRHHFTRHRSEVAHPAGRADRRQQGWAPRSRRLRSSPF